MYIHDYTNPKDIIHDLTKAFAVGDNLNYANNWKVIFPKIPTVTNYPDFWGSPEADPAWDGEFLSLKKAIEDDAFKSILQDTPRVVLKSMPRIEKEWLNNLKVVCTANDNLFLTEANVDGINIPEGAVAVRLPSNPDEDANDAEGDPSPYVLAQDGQVRITVEGKKSNFYRTNDPDKVQVTEFYMKDGSSILILPPSIGEGTVLVLDIEVDRSYTSKIMNQGGYYLELNKPKYTKDEHGEDTLDKNYYYIEWRHGDTYDEESAAPDEGWQGHKFLDERPKWAWYKYPADSLDPDQDWDWLPVEYFLTITQSSAVGVLMGDVGISADDYIASPAYFGALDQIEGALKTDTRGNFAGFSGNASQPNLSKRYGDYTGTGVTDVLMVSTKSGRPYQGHKLGLFGMYEFKEKTFNGLSAHTNKYSMTEIVVADVNENERGTLKNCLAGPRTGKEHGVELVDKRYNAEEEQSYIFLHTNAFYTPFNTSNNVLIGFAIRTDS